MRTVIISMPNTLLASGMVKCLEEEHEFAIHEIRDPDGAAGVSLGAAADVLIVEAREQAPYTLGEWIARREKIAAQRADEKPCRLVVVVDENSLPTLAKEVAQARAERQIDAFLYTSATNAEYLRAVVGSV